MTTGDKPENLLYPCTSKDFFEAGSACEMRPSYERLGVQLSVMHAEGPTSAPHGCWGCHPTQSRPGSLYSILTGKPGCAALVGH